MVALEPLMHAFHWTILDDPTCNWLPLFDSEKHPVSTNRDAFNQRQIYMRGILIALLHKETSGTEEIESGVS
jgi:hypothetical protein